MLLATDFVLFKGIYDILDDIPKNDFFPKLYLFLNILNQRGLFLSNLSVVKRKTLKSNHYLLFYLSFIVIV